MAIMTPLIGGGSIFDQIRNIARESQKLYFSEADVNKLRSSALIEKKLAAISKTISSAEIIEERTKIVLKVIISQIQSARSDLATLVKHLKKQKKELIRKSRKAEAEERELYKKQIELINKKFEHISSIHKETNKLLKEIRSGAILAAKESRELSKKAA